MLIVTVILLFTAFFPLLPWKSFCVYIMCVCGQQHEYPFRAVFQFARDAWTMQENKNSTI